jgi:hypothetical protein
LILEVCGGYGGGGYEEGGGGRASPLGCGWMMSLPRLLPSLYSIGVSNSPSHVAFDLRKVYK